MARKKPPQRPQKRPSLTNRNREVRDLYNKLCKTYKYWLVVQFISQNYRIQESHIMSVIRDSDNDPVDLSKASVTYLAAIKEDFNLQHYVQVSA